MGLRGGVGDRAGAAAHRLPDEAVVDGEDDGGQRDGQHVGQHGGQAHPLLVGLGRHARLLVPGVGGGLAPLRPGLLLLHGGPALGPLLHRPLRGGGSKPPTAAAAANSSSSFSSSSPQDMALLLPPPRARAAPPAPAAAAGRP